MKKTKWQGAIQCLECKFVLVSNYTHDFVSCPCPNNAFVDGGYEYIRYGAQDIKKVQVLKLSKGKRIIR